MLIDRSKQGSSGYQRPLVRNDLISLETGDRRLVEAKSLGHLHLGEGQRLPNFEDRLHGTAYMRMRIKGSSKICADGFVGDQKADYAPRMAKTLAERIKQLRSVRGLDQAQFAKVVGASQSTVTRWEQGSQPKPDALRNIADFAGLTVDELLGVAQPVIEVEGHEIRWVPLIGLAPASSWRDAIEMPMGEVPVKANKAGKRAFGVEIKGDSMDKLLAEGGWAIVDPDQTSLYDNKVYLVANLEHEVTVKRYKSNPARLEPMSHNPYHETLMIALPGVNVLGRIVAYGHDEGL